ncbi:MAG: RNA polymerase subunit sigma-70 [Burkholderiales bacterium]|nr:RNA polymerase subunit sigma-70 [Burkholderiales bacterium]
MEADSSSPTHAALAAARASYGRLLAWLAWQWRDVAAAEDALAEAFAAALEHWPMQGVPASPEGWLVTAARRQLLMAARRRRLAEDPAFTALFPDAEAPAEDAPSIPDARLRLMLVCAHPAIDPSVHCALMLQVVLGVDAARIAGAWLISPEAMTKRLTRAKAKIREARIRFEVPDGADLEERVQSVLEAIYGAFTLDWGRAPEDAAGDLSDEAVYLAELVVAHLPDHAEANGLLALLWLAESRRAARTGSAGEFIPLDRQDPKRWDAALIDQANARLAHAATRQSPGPFQIEAAIQAAHAARAHTGVTPWADIVRLYERLLACAPNVGARIGHAIATAKAGNDPATGLALLHAIDSSAVINHQPWWAAQGYLYERVGSTDRALDAYRRALELTNAPELRAHFERCIAELSAA